jgi:hypothetical protein
MEVRFTLAARHFRFLDWRASAPRPGERVKGAFRAADSPNMGDLRVAARASRAYKLKLSRRGIALLLECHSRLCNLVGDLLPYGMTLRVAVALLDSMPIDELAAELGCEELATFSGGDTHFVGTSPDLAAMAASQLDRVRAAGTIGAARQTGTLYLAALSAMRAAEDRILASTYRILIAGDQAAA